MAKSLAITPNEAASKGLALNRDGQRRSALNCWPTRRFEMAGIARHLAGVIGHWTAAIADPPRDRCQYDV